MVNSAVVDSGRRISCSNDPSHLNLQERFSSPVLMRSLTDAPVGLSAPTEAGFG